MFPTTHDILPAFLYECLKVLEKLLAAGNRILVVTKPHRRCIMALCREFPKYRDQILFRFTITAIDSWLLSYWEPEAPTFSERLACLRYVFENGWQTSVSCEPLLDAQNVNRLVSTVERYVTDTIWIGKMNRIWSRVPPGTSESAICAIENGQTDIQIALIYSRLKDNAKIRWKDSYRKVLRLEAAEAKE